MGAKSSWKGFIRLSLVSIPVKGYNASNNQADIHLNQLHASCKSRIHYQKVCPIHGEVSKEEIVSGYQYEKGQYVVIDPEELEALRTERDHAVNIDTIIPAGTVDQIYFSERTYYLLPDGTIGQKPYKLLLECMQDEDLEAVAKVVLFGHEQIVLLKPHEGVLAISILKYEQEITHASALASELKPATFKKQELSLTKSLLHNFADPDFDISAYRNEYVDKLKKLIDAKVKGEDIVAPPAVEDPKVINLMDALKKSLARSGKAKPTKAERQPTKRKHYATVRSRKSASKTRKSG